MENLYYKYSGRWTVQGIVAGAGLVAAVGIPLAIGCAYGEAYCPDVKGRIFLGAVFAVLMGVAAAGVARRGDIRSAGAAMAAAMIGVLPSFYAAWAVWTYAVVHRNGSSISLATFIAMPNVLWKAIMELGQTGVWQDCLGGSCKVDFVELWVGWIGEALLVFGVPLLFAGTGLSTPFCETCGRWCVQTVGLGAVRAGDDAEMRRRMESKDFRYLAALGTADGTSPVRFTFDVYGCPGCGGINTLTVQKATRGTDKKGQPTESRFPILSQLLLTAAEVQSLRAAIGRG